ncbi:response regulator [Nitrosopumilus adriaticus]|uniref:Response regulator receiver protein n=1 Tax=Nitrosopumilus adriaticus TaxID=1580092 RepID=A0A0D5C4N7_9ARCH|nr:response regulator [Nitrosopumilus adriaticus]AJW71518.1 Response regulator receiver protein [Nitrosopumilus adriaticus]
MNIVPKVIVVDDVQSHLDVFCEFLRLKNIDVVGIGSDGLEAVQLYEKIRPDIVLIDLAMPIYDGHYALEKILSINKNAKIIVMTAIENAKNREMLLEDGAIDVLQKPFELNRVADVINKAFKDQRIISKRYD